LLVSRRGDAEPWWHRKPGADELAKIRCLAPHYGQQVRTDTVELDDEFLVNHTTPLRCGHTPTLAPRPKKLNI
jgi:hypothetical protein